MTPKKEAFHLVYDESGRPVAAIIRYDRHNVLFRLEEMDADEVADLIGTKSKVISKADES